MDLKKQYRKYKWFFTSSGKLVIGGKSAEQNEQLVCEIIKKKKDYIMMHTRKPGSPFSVILEDIEKINAEDLEETAVFTGCFSQQWKISRNATVDMFVSSQVYKDKIMKTGTFGVLGKKQGGYKVKLRLYLKKQKRKLRAVPFKTGSLVLHPGKMKKEKAGEIISEKLKIREQEVLEALPAGGFLIKSEKNE
jgi:hypothetical protein